MNLKESTEEFIPALHY